MSEPTERAEYPFKRADVPAPAEVDQPREVYPFVEMNTGANDAERDFRPHIVSSDAYPDAPDAAKPSSEAAVEPESDDEPSDGAPEPSNAAADADAALELLNRLTPDDPAPRRGKAARSGPDDDDSLL